MAFGFLYTKAIDKTIEQTKPFVVHALCFEVGAKVSERETERGKREGVTDEWKAATGVLKEIE